MLLDMQAFSCGLNPDYIVPLELIIAHMDAHRCKNTRLLIAEKNKYVKEILTKEQLKEEKLEPGIYYVGGDLIKIVTTKYAGDPVNDTDYIATNDSTNWVTLKEYNDRCNEWLLEMMKNISMQYK